MPSQGYIEHVQKHSSGLFDNQRIGRAQEEELLYFLADIRSQIDRLQQKFPLLSSAEFTDNF